MNTISMKLQADELIRLALQEDISSEDVTTNSVMKVKYSSSVSRMVLLPGWMYLKEYLNY